VADDLLKDGESQFVSGQDASKIPAKIAPGFFAAAVNVSLTDGVPGPRWSVAKRKITFPSGGVTDQISNVTVPYEEIFYQGRFQAFIPYSFGGQNYVMIVISGVIYLVDEANLTATVVPVQGGGTLNETTPRLNWSPAGNFLVIFDYPNRPVIFDGITARRSDATKYEVPISTIGAFNQNRLFIGNAGNEYTAGDPVGNNATPDAPITFEEVLAPAAAFLAQVFQLPTNYANSQANEITAMTFLQQTDTSTGIGPLIIGTKNQVFSVQSQLPRSQWQPSGQPTQFASLFVNNAGIAGPRAVINVNSDLFFLSTDGQVRSAAMSRNEQNKWSRVPISREVSNWLKYWDQALVQYSALGYFKNKIFVTANPYRVRAFDTRRRPIYDVAFGGFVSLSTDNIATIRQEGVVAWEGLWTGCRPMDFVTINNRFFIISKDEGSRNELYEVLPEKTYDTDSKGNIRQITSMLYTREHDFKSVDQNKDLYSLMMNLQEIRGDFSMNVKFKPSHGTRFVEWGTFSHDAPWRSCVMPDNCLLNGHAPHNFKNLLMGTPKEFNFCDQVSLLKYGNLREVQLKFTFTGIFWELQDYVINAKVTPQNQIETICTSLNLNSVPLCVDCADNASNWAIGPFESCQTLRT
jgi:hypothetical protein